MMRQTLDRLLISQRLSPRPSLVGTENTASSRVPEIHKGLSRSLDDAVERQLPLQKGSDSKTYLRCHKTGDVVPMVDHFPTILDHRDCGRARCHVAESNAVVRHQAVVAGGEVLTAASVERTDRCAHVVGAMLQRHATEVPEAVF